MVNGILFDNRLCYQREVLRKQKIHRDRVKSMKSTANSNSKAAFDNTSPPEFKHLRRNEKKRQNYKDEIDRIAKSNALLSERMASIKGKPTEVTVRPSTVAGSSTLSSGIAMEFIPGVRLGASQNPVVDCFLTGSNPSRGCAVLKRSLNIEARNRERTRILRENQLLVDRISRQKPFYDTSVWENERKEMVGRLKYLASDTTIGHLPPRPSVEKQKKQKRNHSSIESEKSSPSINAFDAVARKLTMTNIRQLRPLKRGASSTRSIVSKKKSAEMEAIFVENTSVNLLSATSAMGVKYVVTENRATSIDASRGVILTRGFTGISVSAASEIRSGVVTLSLETLKSLICHTCPDADNVIAKLSSIKTTTTAMQLFYTPRPSDLLSEIDLKNILIPIVQSVVICVGSKVKYDLSFPAKLTQLTLASQTIHEAQEAASVKIQAVARGRVARRLFAAQVEHRNDEMARIIQRAARVRQNRKQNAATKIAAVSRGRKCRKDLSQQHILYGKHKRYFVNEVDVQTEHAKKIQALARGRSARNRVMNLRKLSIVAESSASSSMILKEEQEVDLDNTIPDLIIVQEEEEELGAEKVISNAVTDANTITASSSTDVDSTSENDFSSTIPGSSSSSNSDSLEPSKSQSTELGSSSTIVQDNDQAAPITTTTSTESTIENSTIPTELSKEDCEVLTTSSSTIVSESKDAIQDNDEAAPIVSNNTTTTSTEGTIENSTIPTELSKEDCTVLTSSSSSTSTLKDIVATPDTNHPPVISTEKEEITSKDVASTTVLCTNSEDLVVASDTNPTVVQVVCTNSEAESCKSPDSSIAGEDIYSDDEFNS